MPRAQLRDASTWLLPLAASLLISPLTSGQIIWSGLTKEFAKASGTNHTFPEHQDVIIPGIVLTRGAGGGLINISAESSFNPSSSPALTAWATDLNNEGQEIGAQNWESLEFAPWLTAFGGPRSGGAFIDERLAVVHLIPEDIYLELKFTSWTPGQGGGYSYIRSVAPPVTTGDYNESGVVDAADFVFWRNSFGDEVELGDGADGQPNGKIDEADYEFWRRRVGNIVPEEEFSLSAAVPEPASLMLFSFWIVAASGLRRRQPLLTY